MDQDLGTENAPNLQTPKAPGKVSPFATKAAGRLKANIVPVDRLRPVDVIRMHLLFSKYYENTTTERFQTDLAEKDHVILLRDSVNGTIQGFSTLLRVRWRLGKRVVRGVYSGDTVIAKEYWGSPALGLTFLRYLWMEKLRNPMDPLYWFLISKGYKTYLLMSNNFRVHYPRMEKATPPEEQALLDLFYSTRFRGQYNAKTGTIVPKDPEACHLKENIAEIDDRLLKIPRVAFFQKMNPAWRDGVELACIAEMTVLMPLKYALKKIFKRGRR